MLVTYYETIQRNIATGETVFDVTAKEKNTYARHGNIRCMGHIPSYDQGTPLDIKGTFKDGIFYVSDCKLCPEGRVHTELVLRNITDCITDAQMEALLQVTECNLFDFILRMDAIDQLKQVFSKAKYPGRMARRVYDGIKRLQDNELYSVMFLKYAMPLDAVETLIRKRISFDDFKKSPYIIGSKHHIPIVLIDDFALNECGMEPYSFVRICGYTYECMEQSATAGHTCIPIGMLLKSVNWMLTYYSKAPIQIGVSLLAMCINSLSQYLCYSDFNGEVYIYLNYIKSEEDLILKHIKRLLSNPKPISIQKNIKEIEAELGITYNEGQKNAFHMLKTSGIKILTGPPGSGKTAVVEGLIRSTGIKKVALAATTGRAAKIMSDACNRQATTVHKMLEYVPFGDTEHCKDLQNPIDADLIIVDEVSMLGVKLCSLLLNAVKNGTLLLLVGDENQLESVEYGSVLRDMIASGMIEVYRLTEIMRQSGTICDNAYKIQHNDVNLICDQSFQIYHVDDENAAKNMLLQHYNPTTGQILSPIKKGALGVVNIHNLLINYDKPVVLSYGKKDFRIGDKVVMTANNREGGYVNGDIGYVVKEQHGSLVIALDQDRLLEISHRDLADVDFADALTIHKSQGSEYDSVYVVLPEDAASMLTRRILYTAITRAKQHVYIYSVGQALHTAIHNTKDTKRCTILAERIKSLSIWK